MAYEGGAYTRELLWEHAAQKHGDYDDLNCPKCVERRRAAAWAEHAREAASPDPNRPISQEDHRMKSLVIDTEFNRVNLSPKGLISIALVTEDASYYAVNADTGVAMHGLDKESYQWMVANVWKHLPGGHPEKFDRDHPDVKPYRVIADEVNAFLYAACPNLDATRDIELFANCGAQDVVRLHTLLADNDFSQFGPWVPQGADDMYRLKRAAYRRGLSKEELPVQDPEKAHHALHDAEHELDVIEYVRRRLGEV